jgi:hypothetical protein
LPVNINKSPDFMSSRDKIAFGIFCLIATFLIASCGHSDKKEQSAESTDTTAAAPVQNESMDIRNWFNNPDLLKWSQRMSKKDSSFSITHFRKNGEEHLQSQPAISYSREDWKAFLPYLVFSPDHSRAIDLYSYGNIAVKKPDDTDSLEGGDPDSEVSLVDVATKHKQRLLFAGPGTVFQMAAWIDDSTVLITGTSDANPDNKTEPVMWKVNLKDSTLNSYEYQGSDDSTFQ